MPAPGPAPRLVEIPHNQLLRRLYIVSAEHLKPRRTPGGLVSSLDRNAFYAPDTLMKMPSNSLKCRDVPFPQICTPMEPNIINEYSVQTVGGVDDERTPETA